MRLTGLSVVLSDGGVSPAEVVKHVSRLVSSIESMARFPELLGDIDIDRFAFLTHELDYQVAAAQACFNLCSCFSASS